MATLDLILWILMDSVEELLSLDSILCGGLVSLMLPSLGSYNLSFRLGWYILVYYDCLSGWCR